MTSYTNRALPLHIPNGMAHVRICRHVRDNKTSDWFFITRNSCKLFVSTIYEILRKVLESELDSLIRPSFLTAVSLQKSCCLTAMILNGAPVTYLQPHFVYAETLLHQLPWLYISKQLRR